MSENDRKVDNGILLRPVFTAIVHFGECNHKTDTV